MTTSSTVVDVTQNRLALGVECIDALTQRPVGSPIYVKREFGPPGEKRRRPAATVPDFYMRGIARAILMHGPNVPAAVTIRIADARGIFAPRRFKVPLWSLEEVVDSDLRTPATIPAGRRALRPWLLPGGAYPVSRGATAIRGKIVSRGVPIRRTRLTAVTTGPYSAAVGWAHGDRFGEFLLVVERTGYETGAAQPTELHLTFRISYRANVTPAEGDLLGDVPLENVPHPSTPPNDELLQGRNTPDGYVTISTHNPVRVALGANTALPEPIDLSTL
jgi:hypothetical protein